MNMEEFKYSTLSGLAKWLAQSCNIFYLNIAYED